ncbi:MAG: phosphodiester glycosidase family protein [Clostridia bacterium]|nr:phosphodiester glycosidase family protein [Clostridia bacterium]
MRIPKPVLALVSIVVALMILALPFLIPSGAITSRANRAYLNAAGDKDEDFEDGFFYEDDDLAARTFAYPRAAGQRPVAILAFAGASDVPPGRNVMPLPMDNSPGRTPIEGNFTDYSYQDDTISVKMGQKRMYESDVFIAHVKIADASQLRTAYAGAAIDSNRTNHASRIAQNYNAIVAINGDFYHQTKAGYIVRQKEVYREKTSKNMDMLLIDELGDFHILRYGHDVQAEGIEAFQQEHEIMNGFFFGPALVMDSEALEIPKHYQFAPFTANPRAAIGQTGRLTYVLVAVNGRTNGTKGVTIPQLAGIMHELGCEQAYNLDGGNSATLVFHGEVYNDKPQAERSVTDIIYFASAVPDQ